MVYNTGVSKNGGTSKSSILIGISIINRPFWGPHIFGNTHMLVNPKNDHQKASRTSTALSTCLSLLLWSKRCFTYEWVRLTNDPSGSSVQVDQFASFIKWINVNPWMGDPKPKKLHEKNSLQRQPRKKHPSSPYLEVQWGKSSTPTKRSSRRDPTFHSAMIWIPLNP